MKCSAKVCINVQGRKQPSSRMPVLLITNLTFLWGYHKLANIFALIQTILETLKNSDCRYLEQKWKRATEAS